VGGAFLLFFSLFFLVIGIHFICFLVAMCAAVKNEPVASLRLLITFFLLYSSLARGSDATDWCADETNQLPGDLQKFVVIDKEFMQVF